MAYKKKERKKKSTHVDTFREHGCGSSLVEHLDLGLCTGISKWSTECNIRGECENGESK